MSQLLRRSIQASIVVALVAACDSAPPTDLPAPQFANQGGWVEKVSGGGKNAHSPGVTEWISLNVSKSGDGSVSGMVEYANTGIQNWRYKLTPDCMVVYAGGTKAVVIGAVSNTQGPEAPALGTRVAFWIVDNGNGGQQDSGRSVFAGTATCEAVAQGTPPAAPTSGNYTISVR